MVAATSRCSALALAWQLLTHPSRRALVAERPPRRVPPPRARHRITCRTWTGCSSTRSAPACCSTSPRWSRRAPTGVLVVTAIGASVAAVVVTVLLERRNGARAWRWALASPLLLFAFQNWDTFAIAALVGGLVAFERRRPGDRGRAARRGDGDQAVPRGGRPGAARRGAGARRPARRAAPPRRLRGDRARGESAVRARRRSRLVVDDAVPGRARRDMGHGLDVRATARSASRRTGRPPRTSPTWCRWWRSRSGWPHSSRSRCAGGWTRWRRPVRRSRCSCSPTRCTHRPTTCGSWRSSCCCRSPAGCGSRSACSTSRSTSPSSATSTGSRHTRPCSAVLPWLVLARAGVLVVVIAAVVGRREPRRRGCRSPAVSGTACSARVTATRRW